MNLAVEQVKLFVPDLDQILSDLRNASILGVLVLRIRKRIVPIQDSLHWYLIEDFMDIYGVLGLDVLSD